MPAIHDAVPVFVLLQPNCPAGQEAQFCIYANFKSPNGSLAAVPIVGGGINTVNFIYLVVTLLANANTDGAVSNVLSGLKIAIDEYCTLSSETSTSNSTTLSHIVENEFTLRYSNPHIICGNRKSTSIEYISGLAGSHFLSHCKVVPML